MTKTDLRKKITKYQDRRDSELAANRPDSAEMEDRVVRSLKTKLEELIGGVKK